MDNNICYKTKYLWQLLRWDLGPCEEEEECIHCFYCAFFISFLSGLGCVKILNNWGFFFFGVLFYEMISVWMLVLWSGATHTHRRTNPILHTHITTLRNDINKILRELEFLPLWLLLQCRVFYCQTFTKHQQTSRLSAELDMNDRIYFKHLKYSSGYIIFEWNH